MLSGVLIVAQAFEPLIVSLAFSFQSLELECPQQDRANEHEHGAHSEHIQSQRKVHGRCLPF